MAKDLNGGIWRHTRILFNEGVIGDLPDEQLLERFVAAHVRPPKWRSRFWSSDTVGWCSAPAARSFVTNMTPRTHFKRRSWSWRQAASIRNRTSVASWLHGVARRVASRARSAAARRRQHERSAARLAEQLVAESRWDDLAEVLHDEIDRLPEQFRAPIVLCDMEGMTEGQVARRLGRPIGTIRSQLSRGRQQLRRRLIRRGLAPACVVVAMASTGSSANAVIALVLLSSTIQSAMQFAVAGTTAAGMVPASARVLAERFLGSMLMARIRNTAMAALMTIAIATVGAFALEQPGEKSRPAGDAKQELLDLTHAWEKALVESDVGTMDRLLAYELIGTDPTGSLWDKAKYLDHVRRNAFHTESYELKDIKIQVYGNAAVVTGESVGQGQQKGVAVRRGRYVEVREHGSVRRNLAVCRLSSDGDRGWSACRAGAGLG